MHDVNSDDNILDHDLAFSPVLLGKECVCCGSAKLYGKFRRDTSYRDGYRDRCLACESAPRLSTSEHTSRLREMNNNSYAVQAQRWAHQDDYRNDAARVGRPMRSADFVNILQRLIPTLYITDGRIEGDLAVFQTYGQPQPDLDGNTFRYLFYMPKGTLPEFSLYLFDEERDIPIKEKLRGWRTVLLRLIKCGLISEEKVEAVFGPAAGEAAAVYNRTLWQYRNQKNSTN